MLFSLMRSWQLVLLSLTTVALSVASGWTTWDGMSNFTQAPLLSFLITFGIQVIMLVTAWRIGEEFANRPRDPAAQLHHSSHSGIVKLALLAIAFAGAAGLMQLLSHKLQMTLATPAWSDAVLWGSEAPLLGTSGWASLVMAIALALAVFAALRALLVLATSFRTAVHFATRNFIVMSMFLACMATSVFFSFDSLFAIVFPQAERARAAELRALSRAGELVSTITTTQEKQRYAERRALLAGSDWRAYASNLELVSSAMISGAEVLARAASDATADKNRKDLDLKQSLARLEVERHQKQQDRDKLQAARDGKLEKLKVLQEQAGKLEQELMQKRGELSAKRTEAKAEEIGVGMSGQAGKGPNYHGIVKEISLLSLAIDQVETQATANGAQRAVIAKDISQFETQLSEAAISLADFDNRLAIEKQQSTDVAGNATPASVISRLGEDRTLLARRKEEFEKTPSRDQLLALQSACTVAVGRLKDAGQPTPAVATCDASRLQEAAAQLFVLDASAPALKAQCAAQSINAGQNAGFDQSVQRARACLEISGLPSSATARILADIDQLERNRDDRAHRFIVTINAAQDGNRLAYLALALALGIDGLVFFAGVLGANAVRSSLATLPRPWSFNIRRAEEGLRNALAPNALNTARATLRVARPIDAPRPQAPAGAVADGAPAAAMHAVWSHVIDLQDPHLAIAHDIRRLVNTAATIGAARRRPGTADIYELRAELIAFLNEVPLPNEAGATTARDPLDHGSLITASLAPNVHQGASVVVSYMSPSGDTSGYSSELRLDKVRAEHEVLLRRFVNAASAAGGVIVVACEDPKKRLILLHEQVCRIVVALASPPRVQPQPPQSRPTATAVAPAHAAAPPPTRPVEQSLTPAAASPTAPPPKSVPPPKPQGSAAAPPAARTSVHSTTTTPPQQIRQPQAQTPILPAATTHAANRPHNADQGREVAQTSTPPQSISQPRITPAMPIATPPAETLPMASGAGMSDLQPGLKPHHVEVARPPTREGERRAPMRISIQGDTISFGDVE